MLKQTFIQFEQADHRTHQTQIPALFSPQCDSPHQLKGLLGSSHQQLHPQHYDHQQGNRKQRKHSRPRLDSFDARFGKSQLPFQVTKSLLASKASGVFLGRLLAALPLIRKQIPHLPLTLSIACSTHTHKPLSWRRLTIINPSQIALPRIAYKTQSIVKEFRQQTGITQEFLAKILNIDARNSAQMGEWFNSSSTLYSIRS
jgi:hypothetical protein